MNINIYDTLVGKPLRVVDEIADIIKMLAIRKDLLETPQNNVFVIDYKTANDIPNLPAPLTIKDHSNRFITVYDDRPFRNKAGRVLSQSELNIIRLTAYLQQEAIMGNTTVLASSKFIIVRGVVGAITELLGGTRLDLEEKNTLKIIATHFVNCIFEGDTPETGYLSTNVIKTVWNLDAAFSSYIIDELGFLGDTGKFVDAFRNEPSLFKLKSTSLSDFVAQMGRLSMFGVGSKVMRCIPEAPCLAAGFVYATVTNSHFNKTPIGVQLNPKYHKELIDAFIKTINYNYDLSPVV